MKQEKPNNHLLRRVLMPLLIVTMPIAAMIAYILYHKQARSSLQPPVPAQTSESVSFGNDSWPIFRGNAALAGRAAGDLPDELVLTWKFQAKDAVRSTPVVSVGKVFVTSLDKHLYAIDLETGKEIWRFKADDEIEASALYHNGFLYVGSNSGRFYAVNAATGKEAWTHDTDGKIAGSANISIHPDTKRTVILFGSYDNILYCLDAVTGEIVFQYAAEYYINGSIAIADHAAVFGSCDANIYRVPIADPNAATTIDAGSYVAANPAIDNNTIFAGSFEGDFLAADATSQTVLWQFKEGNDAFISAPAFNETVVIVGCRDEKVYCFDRSTGDIRWTFTAQESFDSSPVICGDKIAIGCDDGRLYLLDIQTGQETFSYTLGSPVASSAAIAQDHLIIGCDNGTVYAFIGR